MSINGKDSSCGGEAQIPSNNGSLGKRPEAEESPDLSQRRGRGDFQRHKKQSEKLGGALRRTLSVITAYMIKNENAFSRIPPQIDI